MNLTTTYQGSNDPFEGDLTLWLRGLPTGARVTKAVVKLEPVALPGGTLLEETITFTDGQGDLGAIKITGTTLTSDFVEVDFHTRRTLVAVVGTGTTTPGANFQVDMGGAYVGIANDGTIMTPDKEPWAVDLLSGRAPLPGLMVNKFRLDEPDSSGTTLDITNVTIRSVPTNVSVHLDQMPPFWTHLGELAISQTSPDFSAVMNAYLAEATVEKGFYVIPFVVHSDTIARLNVELTIDYVIEQPVLPSYLPEVNLPYGYSSLPGVEEELLTVKLPRGATISDTHGAVLGTFDATRVVFGEIGEAGATSIVTISPEQSLAQPIKLEKETPVNGIDLPLANTEPGLAGLHLALQEDSDGKPSGEELTSAGVSVKKPVPGGSAWGSAALPTEFRFLSGVRYWLVLQSIQGKAQWEVKHLEPGEQADPVLQASNDGCFSWRMAATEQGEKPLVSVFRLRHTPDQFKIPLQLQIGREPDAQRTLFDRFAPLGRVEFDLDFGSELGEYLASPALASPCGRSELLTNSSFDLPPHDDATRRLFGFDTGSATGGNSGYSISASLTSRVNLDRGIDLSVQRFILLSIDIGDPIRIDCAGIIPARTNKEEVVKAINRAVRNNVAEYDDVLVITSPTGGDSSSVKLHSWRQAGVPLGWQCPAEAEDQIWRFMWPPIRLIDLDNGPETLPAESIVAALKAEGDKPAVLSQNVPVAGGCTYVLHFRFPLPDIFSKDSLFEYGIVSRFAAQLLEVPRFAAPSWEVSWLDAEGQLIHSEGEEFNQPNQYFIEERLVAPSGAAHANVRFIQPPPGIFVLDAISFTPTLETLTNSTFSLWDTEDAAVEGLLIPLGWDIISGWVNSYSLDVPIPAKKVLLRGMGPNGETLSEDAVIAQKVNVLADLDYQLQVSARSMSLADAENRPPEQRPRLELRWITDEGETGKPEILPLDGRDFPLHARTSTAPNGATQAEIRLIQPQGLGDLVVESVSLEQSDLVSVPLIFLAEAPGELVVSNLRVTYDVPILPKSTMLTPRGTTKRLALRARRLSNLADQPATIVSGVSNRSFDILNNLPTPVKTIGELAAIDSSMSINGISPERFLEIKAAAEIALDSTVESDSFASLADWPLEKVMRLSPANLAHETSQSKERAEQFQRNLHALRLVLKNEAFNNLRLSDLMS